MKGKTSAHIPGKLQTPGKPGDGSVRCSLCQEGGLFGGESGIFKEKFYFQPCDPQGEETSQTAPKSRKSGLFPLRGNATRAEISLISSQSWSRRREFWKLLGYGAFWGPGGVSLGFGNATRRRRILGQLWDHSRERRGVSPKRSPVTPSYCPLPLPAAPPAQPPGDPSAPS